MRFFKLTLLLLLMFASSMLYIQAQTVDAKEYSKLKDSIGLQPGQMMLIYFYAEGNCPSCITVILNDFYCLKNKELSNVKLLCFVRGEREREIRPFKKAHEKLCPIKLNSKQIEAKLGLKLGSTLALIDYNGKIILDLDLKEATSFGMCKKIGKYVE